MPAFAIAGEWQIPHLCRQCLPLVSPSADCSGLEGTARSCVHHLCCRWPRACLTRWVGIRYTWACLWSIRPEVRSSAAPAPPLALPPSSSDRSSNSTPSAANRATTLSLISQLGWVTSDEWQFDRDTHRARPSWHVISFGHNGESDGWETIGPGTAAKQWQASWNSGKCMILVTFWLISLNAGKCMTKQALGIEADAQLLCCLTKRRSELSAVSPQRSLQPSFNWSYQGQQTSTLRPPI